MYMSEEFKAEQENAEEKPEKVGFFKRLVSGLTKTRDNIVSGIDSIFSGFALSMISSGEKPIVFNTPLLFLIASLRLRVLSII